MRKAPSYWPMRAFALALLVSIGVSAMSQAVCAQNDVRKARVMTGAELLVRSGFAPLRGKAVGLIANQTTLVQGRHLADIMHASPEVSLKAILGPEHGFRGRVEAGKSVRDGVDPATGIPVFSLYGTTRKPSQAMLRGLDVLVFDIQDIGARFYTYISTMGLAMQAAAEAGIPFVVLDRPNPLGGDYVSGFVREDGLTSFVGQYPIPIVHGLTVAELAIMIKGERWLDGLEKLDLQIMKMEGWARNMRWPSTGLEWVATSPNIPTFETALVYPGVGMIGETQLVNEGRGTPAPFTVFGAPWLDASRMAARLNALRLPGISFDAVRYRPKSIRGVAAYPKFVGQMINGVRLDVRNVARFEPLEAGIHALALVIQQARSGRTRRLFANVDMFHKISGTRRLHRMLLAGATGAAIVASWRHEVQAFREQRKSYLLY